MSHKHLSFKFLLFLFVFTGLGLSIGSLAQEPPQPPDDALPDSSTVDAMAIQFTIETRQLDHEESERVTQSTEDEAWRYVSDLETHWPTPLTAAAKNGPIAYVGTDGYLHLMNPDGTAQRRIFDDLPNVDWPRWSSDSQYLAFTAEGENGRCLYKLRLDTQTYTELVCDFADIFTPDWSPQSSRIAFFGEQEDGTGRQAWALNADGSGLTGLAPELDRTLHPVWVDEDKIVFPGEGPAQVWKLYVVNFEQPDDPQPITPKFTSPSLCGPQGPQVVFPDVSPDGQKIAFQGIRFVEGWPTCTACLGLYLVDPAGESPPSRIVDLASSNSNLIMAMLRWAPDNQRVGVYGGSEHQLRLNVVDTTSGDRTVFPHREGTDGGALDWAPDGTQLAVGYAPSGSEPVVESVDPISQIFTVLASGKRPAWAALLLDLPVSYSNFARAALGNVDGHGPGLVNSWFDHTSPDYTENMTVTIWTGAVYTDAIIANLNSRNCDTGVNCYNGHNGVDFRRRNTGEQVFAAASGTVTKTVSYCQAGVSSCGNLYGNQVWIVHGGGYATRYAHLATVSVSDSTVITAIVSQPLGTMGNTGNSEGIHLHFGAYYDQNGDKQWTANEVVDPYGWFGSTSDPNPLDVPSHYLWKYPLWTQATAGSSGVDLTSPSGIVEIAVPSDALSSTVTLELWDAPPVAKASAELRSTGLSFWLRVLEWLTGGGVSTNEALSNGGFSQPATITVTYEITDTRHLDADQLAVYRWDESSSAWAVLPTVVDTNQHEAVAQTTEIGHFDLQAPLLHPADNLEPNDNYDAASTILADGTPVGNLFDIAEDEDWFRLEGMAECRYVVQTSNLAIGVDTVVEVYDLDGVTLLASDDDSGTGRASYMEWDAPLDGVYFIRVVRASGSAYGDGTIYELNVGQVCQLYLPLILRNS